MREYIIKQKRYLSICKFTISFVSLEIFFGYLAPIRDFTVWPPRHRKRSSSLPKKIDISGYFLWTLSISNGYIRLPTVDISITVCHLLQCGDRRGIYTTIGNKTAKALHQSTSHTAGPEGFIFRLVCLPTALATATDEPTSHSNFRPNDRETVAGTLKSLIAPPPSPFFSFKFTPFPPQQYSKQSSADRHYAIKELVN